MSGGNRFWIRTGALVRIPLTYVENCAKQSSWPHLPRRPRAKRSTLSMIAVPTQRQFTRMVLRRLSPRRMVIPVSYSLLRLTAGSIALVNKRLLGNRADSEPAGSVAPCRPKPAASILE